MRSKVGFRCGVRGLCWFGMSLWLVAATTASPRAEVPAPGGAVQGQLDLGGKQIVLPDGEWVVAGHGYDQVAGLEDVPYGAIENVVLFRLDGSRVTAFVIAQRNVIAIENGWGLAPECVRSDLLGLVVYDAAEGHSFCGFVDHVATAVDSTSASALASRHGLCGQSGPGASAGLADGGLPPQRPHRHARRPIPFRSRAGGLPRRHRGRTR